MTRIFVCIFLFSMCAYSQNPLPAPYNEIVVPLPFADPYDSDPSARYRSIFEANKIEVVIEIGSWLGNSARFFASKIPEHGKVYAVDHWLGSKEQQSDPFIPNLYEQFLSNIIHFGLTHKIIPIKMPSTEAAKYLNGVKPDLIYIDGSHETEDVLDDLRAWYPYVKDHGIFCGDDWTSEAVAKAVKIFAKEQNLVIHSPSHNFWVLHKRQYNWTAINHL